MTHLFMNLICMGLVSQAFAANVCGFSPATGAGARPAIRARHTRTRGLAGPTRAVSGFPIAAKASLPVYRMVTASGATALLLDVLAGP